MKTIIGSLLIMAAFLCGNVAIAQIPVEVVAGHKKATLDIMFFKFIKKQEGQNTRWLFFNRNRVSMDYAMTETTNLPQFGFTEAFSYNHEKLKGFAPVAVASISSRTIEPKLGVQFAKIKKDFVIFTWAVSEVAKDPNVDVFFLGRFTPQIKDKLHLYSQIELIEIFPTVDQNTMSFYQRIRLGIKLSEFQVGFAADLTQIGRNVFTNSENLGGFLRYEF